MVLALILRQVVRQAVMEAWGIIVVARLCKVAGVFYAITLRLLQFKEPNRGTVPNAK